MEPIDDSPQETSSQQDEAAECTEGHELEVLHIEPEVGAALMLSGNYSRALAERVFSGLTPDEVLRLGQGLIRVKSLSEEQFEKIWNQITPMFTGDWREEEDLVEFIRVILRSGVRNEPALTPAQKMAFLLLSLHEDTSVAVHGHLLRGLSRGAANELTRELAHLLHYPPGPVQERVLGEFMAFCTARALPDVGFMSATVMQMEADRLVHRDARSCAELVDRLWLAESQHAGCLDAEAQVRPDKIAMLFKAYAHGGSRWHYLPPLQRAAIFRVSLSPQATIALDEALRLEDDRLPEPFVSPARQEAVLREFLHHFYLEYASQIPVILQ